MHLDFSPDIAGGALFPYLEGMANQSFGMVIGKGGADTIIKAMVGMADGTRRRDHPGAEVAEITVAGGKATGIRLASGRDAYGDARPVIANVAPRALFGRLLPDGSGDAGFDRRMRNFRHAPGTMMMHLALDALPDWRAGEELQALRLCASRARRST